MTFDDGVTEILQADVQTYAQYLDLTTIVIPTSVVTICGTIYSYIPDNTDGAFSNMPNLTTITFNSPSSLTIIGMGAFSNDYSIIDIILPSGLIYIGDGAFSVWDNPINSIPASVTYIGGSAFINGEITNYTYRNTTQLVGNGGANSSSFFACNITNFTIDVSAQNIPADAVFYCGFVTTVIIPSNVITIGDNGFEGCYFGGGTGTDCGLILSKGLQYIGFAAFSYPDNFTGNLTLIIPPSTRFIGDFAFAQSNLTDITYTSTTALGTTPFPSGANITILPGPDPPTDISGIWNPSSIDLLWTAPTQTGATPVAYYLITDTSDSTVYQTQNNNTNYTVTGTDPNAIYTYTIQTVNQDEAISTASTSVSAGPPPFPPTNLSATPSYGSLALNWTAPTQTGGGTITNYTYNYYTVDSRSYIPLQYISQFPRSHAAGGGSVRTYYSRDAWSLFSSGGNPGNAGEHGYCIIQF
jgi:hypothetical protein